MVETDDDIKENIRLLSSIDSELRKQNHMWGQLYPQEGDEEAMPSENITLAGSATTSKTWTFEPYKKYYFSSVSTGLAVGAFNYTWTFSNTEGKFSGKKVFNYWAVTFFWPLIAAPGSTLKLDVVNTGATTTDFITFGAWARKVA